VQIPVSRRKSLKKPNGAHFEPMVQRPYQHGTVAGVLTGFFSMASLLGSAPSQLFAGASPTRGTVSRTGLPEARIF
jgi:hypothetical protein